MIRQRPCPRCGATIHEVVPRPAGRPRRWCSDRCRRAASEERRAGRAGVVALEFVSREVSLDEHVDAVLGSPAACRRVLKALRERYEWGGLGDARWGSVAEEMARPLAAAGGRRLQWGAR